MTNIEEIKNFVTEGYRNILQREPDPIGLEHHIRLIQTGAISRDTFLSALRNSEEYKIMFRPFQNVKWTCNDKPISVLIRTHKRPKSLRICLNSLNRQTKNNFCVIIISDDKDDNVEGLAGEYPNLYFVFKHIEPLGYPSCNLYFNQVKSIIDADYVIFIDDDDEIIDNTYLETLENIYVKNGRPAVIMSRVSYGEQVIPSDDGWANLPCASNIGTLNFCVRSDIYRNCDWTNDNLGDFHFINSVFNSIDWKKDVYWHNKIMVAARNYPGRGKSE